MVSSKAFQYYAKNCRLTANTLHENINFTFYTYIYFHKNVNAALKLRELRALTAL